MNERIDKIIKSNNLNNSSFAELIGIQKSAISHILSGRNKPSLDIIIKILSIFPKINPDWLIFGKLPYLRDSNIDNKKNNYPIPESNKEIINKSNKRIKKIIVIYQDDTFEEHIKTTN